MSEYINRELASKRLTSYAKGIDETDTFGAMLRAIISDIPAADVRPVVLCRDCEYWQSDCGWCGYFDIGMNIDDFCSRGNKEE